MSSSNAENESCQDSINVKVERIKQVLKDTVTQDATSCKKGKVPNGAQATPQLITFDISQLFPNNKYDEIIANLFLGDGSFAKDYAGLKKLRITHVVNTAQGKKFSMVDTSEEFYAPLKIKFHGMEGLMDVAGSNIAQHLRPAAEFIHDALQNNGRVYVHCFQGISRSSSTVIAYLMLYKSQTLEEAVRTVKTRRAVSPNAGFIKQLIQLEEEIRKAKANL